MSLTMPTAAAQLVMGENITNHYSIWVNRGSGRHPVQLVFACKVADTEHKHFTSVPGEARLGRGSTGLQALNIEAARCESRNGVKSAKEFGLILAPFTNPVTLVNGEKEDEVARQLTLLGLEGREAFRCALPMIFCFFSAINLSLRQVHIPSRRRCWRKRYCRACAQISAVQQLDQGGVRRHLKDGVFSLVYCPLGVVVRFD
jgi:hypothetical protein